MMSEMILSFRDRYRFKRLVADRHERGASTLDENAPAEFRTETYQTLALLFLFRSSPAYREKVDLESISKRIYDAIEQYILNDNACQYLKLYFITFLNEIEERPSWLDGLDEDFSFYEFRVDRLIRNTFVLLRHNDTSQPPQ